MSGYMNFATADWDRQLSEEPKQELRITTPVPKYCSVCHKVTTTKFSLCENCKQIGEKEAGCIAAYLTQNNPETKSNTMVVCVVCNQDTGYLKTGKGLDLCALCFQRGNSQVEKLFPNVQSERHCVCGLKKPLLSPLCKYCLITAIKLFAAQAMVKANSGG